MFRIIYLFLVTSIVSACGPANDHMGTLRADESGLVCKRSEKPACFVDGKEVEISEKGLPLTDAAGSYIFKGSLYEFSN